MPYVHPDVIDTEKLNWSPFEHMKLSDSCLYLLIFISSMNLKHWLVKGGHFASCHVFMVICHDFVIQGDDGAAEEPQQGILVKESESLYTLWCSGRAGCNGMLVELKVHVH